MKTLISFIGILLFSFNVYCQTEELNLAKYWLYRDRFQNNFISIGEGDGKSIPAAHIAYAIYDGKGRAIHWGDATIYLGNYLALLSTEFELLRVNNGSQQLKDQTLKELYYALKAYNRLDVKANQDYPTTGDFSGTTGWYRRDDVKDDPNFINNFPKVINPNLQKGDDFYNIGSVSADYSPKCTETNEGDGDLNSWNSRRYVSLDQTTGMLFGLSFVLKYVPQSTNYNGENVVYMASKIYHHIVKRYYSGEVSGIRGLMKDPADNKLSNCAGGDARTSIYSMLKAHDNFVYIFNDFNFNNTANLLLWQGWVEFTQGKNVAENLLSIIKDQDTRVGHSYNTNLLLRLMSISNSHLLIDMNQISQKDEKYLYPFANYVLYPSPDKTLVLNTIKPSMESKLNYAPCEGPCSIREREKSSEVKNESCNCSRSPGWVGNDKWDLELPEQNTTTIENFWEAEPTIYVGLDYMLAYNLYRLAYSPNTGYNKIEYNLTSDKALVRLDDTGNQPIPSIFSSSKIVSTYFKDIIRSQIVLNNYNERLNYRSKTFVLLEPGFNSNNNGTFVAEIVKCK